MRIIGYHASNNVICNSDSEVCSEPPFIDFLLEPKENCIKVFYHMGYAVANILKMLHLWEQEGKWLQDKGELRTEPYFIKHRAGKFLSIKKGHYWNSPFANFSDMSQYIPTEFKSKEETTKTCLQKAKQAMEAGEIVYKTLLDIGLHPTSLTSPINAFNKEVLSKMGLPTIDDIPEEAGFYAYECCQGSWMEAFQLGHWDIAHDYDINSAYPYELSKLLDIRLGKWIKSTEWIPEAKYAFCKGIVMVHSSISPVIFNRRDAKDTKLNYTPTGSWERYLNKSKIQHIWNHDLGGFHLIDGWFWIPFEEVKTLNVIVNQLYRHKEKNEGIAKDVIKRIMSGIWGMTLQIRSEKNEKTGELKSGFGDFFNPVYGAEVESNVRVEVSRFIQNNRLNPIHVSLDGVLSPKPIVLGDMNKGMGSWELASASPAICAGTAAVAIQGRTGTADFSIDYDWLIEQIKANPDASEYTMKKLSPVTLAVALNGDWNKLGELREITKAVYAEEDAKRYYKEKPTCGRDLLNRHYNSEPWDISMLQSFIKRER